MVRERKKNGFPGIGANGNEAGRLNLRGGLFPGRGFPFFVVVIATVILLCGVFRAPAFAFEPDRESHLERLFDRTSGWIGGDGAYSVPLDHDHLLWFFGDSFIGRNFGGKRVKAVMVNNVVGVQTRPGKRGTRVTFHFRDQSGKAASFFTPPDRKGWFWPLHGVRIGPRLFLFLLQITATDETSVFGFKPVGLWLATVSNPDSLPRDWRIAYRKVPWASFSEGRNMFPGSAILRIGRATYIYGIEETVTKKGSEKWLVLARTGNGDLGLFRNWEFLSGRGWTPDFRKAARLCPGMATEFSVTPVTETSVTPVTETSVTPVTGPSVTPVTEPSVTVVEGASQLALVYSEANLSRRILARTAPCPEGPWSAPVELATCMDFANDRDIFFYAGKAHPALAGKDGSLPVSFVSNSLNFFDLLRDNTLYRPRFFRIPREVLDANPTTGRMCPKSQDGAVLEDTSPTTGRMCPKSQDGAVLEDTRPHPGKR